MFVDNRVYYLNKLRLVILLCNTHCPGFHRTDYFTKCSIIAKDYKLHWWSFLSTKHVVSLWFVFIVCFWERWASTWKFKFVHARTFPRDQMEGIQIKNTSWTSNCDQTFDEAQAFAGRFQGATWAKNTKHEFQISGCFKTTKSFKVLKRNIPYIVSFQSSV